jgi:hypothetical protein
MGLDTKTDWPTNRRSQRDSDSDSCYIYVHIMLNRQVELERNTLTFRIFQYLPAREEKTPSVAQLRLSWNVRNWNEASLLLVSLQLTVSSRVVFPHREHIRRLFTATANAYTHKTAPFYPSLYVVLEHHIFSGSTFLSLLFMNCSRDSRGCEPSSHKCGSVP